MTYGVCFCGALRVQVSSEPVVRALCHYRSCRAWGGGVGQKQATPNHPVPAACGNHRILQAGE